MDNYEKFLPHIDVNDGKARIMNNMNLYITLLKKFKGRQMTDDLLAAIAASEMDKIVQLSHALRGTASKLSCPTLQEVTSEIESLAKEGKDSSHLTKQLDTAMKALDESIAELTTA